MSTALIRNDGAGRRVSCRTPSCKELYGLRHLPSLEFGHFWRMEELGIRNHPKLRLVEYDLIDFSTSIPLLQQTGAKEVNNLAAQSLVGVRLTSRLRRRKSPVLVPSIFWKQSGLSTMT